MTVTDKQGQLVDLDEEKIYELEFNKKRYKVTTFEEYRQRIEEAQRTMAEATQGREPQPSGDPSKEMEIDFDVTETGQRKAVNGQDCRQIVMTVTMRESALRVERSA